MSAIVSDGLTDRQRDILEYMSQYLGERGYPPTLREIGGFFGIASPSAVRGHLEALRKKGFIGITSAASRGVEILKTADGADFDGFARSEIPGTRIPRLGAIAAGGPIEAIENREGELTIDPDFFPNAESCFALRVEGESMIEIGIFDGDAVIVDSKAACRSGDVVAAVLDEAATVKRLRRENGRVYLIPENARYEPILVEEDRPFRIAGKVVGVMRRM